MDFREISALHEASHAIANAFAPRIPATRWASLDATHLAPLGDDLSDQGLEEVVRVALAGAVGEAIADLDPCWRGSSDEQLTLLAARLWGYRRIRAGDLTPEGIRRASRATERMLRRAAAVVELQLRGSWAAVERVADFILTTGMCPGEHVGFIVASTPAAPRLTERPERFNELLAHAEGDAEFARAARAAVRAAA